MAVLCSTQVMWPLPLVELHAVGRAWNPNVAKSREAGVFLPVGNSAPCINAPGLSMRPPPVIRKHAALTAQNSGRGATERAGVAESRQATATTAAARDRKSTRLNSSHRTISYAVFCLKKKKKNNTPTQENNAKHLMISTHKISHAQLTLHYHI